MFFKNQRKFIAVDADSIEEQIRAVIIRAAARHNVNVLFVADRHLQDVAVAHMRGAPVSMTVVHTDFDSADDRIVSLSSEMLFCVSHDKGVSDRLKAVGIETIDERGKSLDGNVFPDKTRLNAKAIEKFTGEFNRLIEKTSRAEGNAPEPDAHEGKR